MTKSIVTICFLTCLLLAFRPSHAQGIEGSSNSERDSNGHPLVKALSIVNLEFGGNAGALSMNLYYLTRYRFGLRGGFGLFPGSTTGQPGTSPVILLMPVYFSPVPKSYFLEWGIGTLFYPNSNYFESWLGTHNKSKFLLTAAIGLRYLAEDGGVSFSLSLTPFIGLRSRVIFPFVGFSIGYSF
ncbi:MAG: hypothetical protein ABI778_03545 [Ignavibacteriota bacterium]